MILTIAAFTQLAAACGPSVHVDTLAAVAHNESRLNTLAIGDNTAGRSYKPGSVQEAIAIANALMAKGHSLDLGLMQVNTANLRGLRMTVADTFDPCKSIAAGARVLVEGYRPAGSEDNQATLLRALSHYNTGNAQRGFRNGYVRRVQASAQQVVPAIRLGGGAVVVAGPEGGEAVVAAPPAPPPAPPSWDVFANARYRRENGDAPMVQPQQAPQVQQEVAPNPGQAAPVILQQVTAQGPLNGL